MSEIFEVIPDNSVHSNVERLLFQSPDEMCIVDNAQQQQQQQQQQQPKSRRRLRSRSRSRSRNANAAAAAATTVENNTKRNNNVNKSSIFRNVFPSSSSPTIAIATSPSPSRRANVSNVNNVKRLPPKPPLSKKWAFPKPYFSSCKENESPTLPSSMKLRDQEDPRMTKSYHPPSSASVTSAHNNNNNIGGMLYQKYHNSMDDAHGDDMHDTTALMSDDELSTQFHNSGPATVTGALSIGNSSSHYHHQHHYHDDYSVKSSDIYSYVSAQSQSQFGGTIGAVGGGGGGGVGGGFYNHYYYNDHHHHHHYDGGSTVGGGDGTTVAGGGGTVKTFRTRGSQRSTRSAKTHKSVRRANRRRKRKKVLKDWKMKMNDSLNLISKMSGFVIGGGAPSSPPHKDDHDGNHHHHHYCPYNHVSDSDGGDQEEEDLYKSYHERQLHYMNNFHDEQENCAETNNNNTTSTNKVTSSNNGLQFSPLRPKSTNVPFDETSPLRSSMHSPTGLLRPTRSFSDAIPPPVEAISSHSSFSRGTYSQNKGVAMLEKDNPSEQQQEEEEPAEYAQLMFGPGLGLCNGVEESSPPKKNTNSHSQNQNNPRPPQASSPNPRGVVNPSTKATPVVSVAQPSPQRSIKSTPNISSPALSSPPRRTRTPPSATTSYHKTPNNGTQMNFNTPPSTPQRESASSSSGANGSTPIGKMLSTNHSTTGSTASPLSMTETIESLRSNPPPPPPLPPRREKQRSAPNPETLIGNRLPLKKSSSSPLSKDNTFQPATVTSNGIDKNTSNATTNDLPNSRMEAVPKTPPKGLSKHNSDNRHDKPRNPLPKASLPTDSPTTPTTAVTTASTPTKKIASSPTRNRNSLNTTSQVPSPNRNRAASSKIAPSPIRTKQQQQQQQQQSLPTRRAAPVSTTVHKTIHRHNRHNKDADAYKRQTYGYGVPFGVYIHPTQSCDTSIDRERHDDELWETLGSPWDEDIVTVIKPHKSPQKKKYNRNHNYHHDQSCRNQPSVNNNKVKSKGGGVSTRKVAEYLYYKKSGDNGQKVTLKGTTAANGLSGSMHDSHPFDEGKHHQQHQKFKCQCVRCSAKSIYADLL